MTQILRQKIQKHPKAIIHMGSIERMDSGYFDEEIIETIETLGCKYLINAQKIWLMLKKRNFWFDVEF